MSTDTSHRTIDIELLALDLNTCGRCTGTDKNLSEAIDTVAGFLRGGGTRVRVTRHVVTTAEQAERLRFVASPTIRIDGQDIALEFRESNCKDCGDLCGCEGGVDCRVWVWQGQEYLEAPADMIVNALLEAHAAGHQPADTTPYVMPDNLRNYFASATARSANAPRAGSSECCDTNACCEPAEKDSCCGTPEGVASAADCRCR